MTIVASLLILIMSDLASRVKICCLEYVVSQGANN